MVMVSIGNGNPVLLLVYCRFIPLSSHFWIRIVAPDSAEKEVEKWENMHSWVTPFVWFGEVIEPDYSSTPFSDIRFVHQMIQEMSLK